MIAPEIAATDAAPLESILSLTSLDAEPAPSGETQDEAGSVADAEIPPDSGGTAPADETHSIEMDEDALGEDLAGSLDEELENDPDFTDVVRSAVSKIGGEILFEVENVPDSGHVAAVSMGDGDARRFVLVIQPADGSPLRVEPAEESANPLAQLAESYAGLVDAWKKAA